MTDKIIEDTCRKCGSYEKIWNNIKERYDCMQCGKKWQKIQKTGYKGDGKPIKLWKTLKWMGKLFSGKL